MYRVFADLVLLTHALFVAFVMFGGLLVVWKPRVAPWHLAALAWGAAAVGLGWICPLTPLENSLRQLAGQEGYYGGFIEHYLTQIIYPPGLTRQIQIWLALGLLVGNALVYGWVFRRWRNGVAPMAIPNTHAPLHNRRHSRGARSSTGGRCRIRSVGEGHACRYTAPKAQGRLTPC
ncbi:DUF2784 domain-containing protein [Pusillimonas sp. T7-7]|uniref:DUF2784 domain-containing protein n=1 Tax=Pusillimonas sp. (strain T7-7) TaxID=1007105 RepID=UPI0009FBDB7F